MSNGNDFEDKSVSADSPNDLINKIISEEWLILEEKNPVLYKKLKQGRDNAKNTIIVDESNYIPCIKEDSLPIPIITEEIKRNTKSEDIFAMSKKHIEISRKLKSLQKHQISLICTFNWIVISCLSS